MCLESTVVPPPPPAFSVKRYGLLLHPAPVCMRCGITRPHRVLVLTCTVTGSALLWWAFSLPTWAKVDVPDSPQVLFSALFAICSQEVRCWVPPSKSYGFAFGRIFMISALLLSFFLNITLLAFPHALPDTWKQYFVFTITCFIVGILCFVSAHRCWFQCVVQRPIQVKPLQTPVASPCPVAVTESKPGGGS
ncbi:transmembrane protein 225B-like isoform X3 [Myotis daubentonii]|uniref:transmembrane protein 225B-like isoform X3 n=1 Tax=Myotis daubentonii TaxID=98922 RepID=UPI002872CEBE|nr:transmembrane protein 225B-like isoform X3 [Myotis daubentonii]